MSLKRPKKFTEIEIRESIQYKKFKKEQLSKEKKSPKKDNIFSSLELLNSCKSIKLPNGSLYKGQTKEGKIHGKGKLKLKNGDIYIGEFSDGCKHGKGYIKRKSGKIEEVEFYYDIEVHNCESLENSGFKTVENVEEESNAFYGGNENLYQRDSGVQNCDDYPDNGFNKSSNGVKTTRHNSKNVERDIKFSSILNKRSTFDQKNNTFNENNRNFQSRLQEKLKKKRCFRNINNSNKVNNHNLKENSIIPDSYIKKEKSLKVEQDKNLDKENSHFSNLNKKIKQVIKASFLDQEWSPTITQDLTLDKSQFEVEEFITMIKPAQVQSLNFTEEEAKSILGMEMSEIIHELEGITPKMIQSEAFAFDQSEAIESHFNRGDYLASLKNCEKNENSRLFKKNVKKILEFISSQNAYFYPESHIEIKNKSVLRHVCPYQIEEIESHEEESRSVEWGFLNE